MTFCSKCGKENHEDVEFCPKCGNQLKDFPQNESSISHQTSGVRNVNSSSVYAILGWIFTGISILFIPILFGAGGVIFGYLHRKVNKSHGSIIIIAAIACALFGTVLGAAIATY